MCVVMRQSKANSSCVNLLGNKLDSNFDLLFPLTLPSVAVCLSPASLQRPHRGVFHVPCGGEVPDDQALLTGVAVALPVVSWSDPDHSAVCLRLPGLLPPSGVRHRPVWLSAALRPAGLRHVHPRTGPVQTHCSGGVLIVEVTQMTQIT